MDRYNHFRIIAAGAVLGVLIGMVAIIVIPPAAVPSPPTTVGTVTSLLLIPNDVVPPTTVPTTGRVEKIEDDIFVPLFMTAPTDTVGIYTVCNDFDNGLWFWDMYEERLSQLLIEDGAVATHDDADTLLIGMGDEVTLFCPDHTDRLPTELLVPDVLLPGESD